MVCVYVAMVCVYATIMQCLENNKLHFGYIFFLDFSSSADEKHELYLQERDEFLKQNKVSSTLSVPA